MADWHRNGGTSSLSPVSRPGSSNSEPDTTSKPPSVSSGRARLVAWTLVSILMAGCAILAAAILWKARTLPRTPRAFFETRFRVEASFRVLLRELRVSGDWEREGGAVIMCPALPSDGSSLVPLEGSGCGRDDICSVDRSGQLWQLPLVVIFLARFSGLTVTVCCRLISREG